MVYRVVRGSLALGHIRRDECMHIPHEASILYRILQAHDIVMLVVIVSLGAGGFAHHQVNACGVPSDGVPLPQDRLNSAFHHSKNLSQEVRHEIVDTCGRRSGSVTKRKCLGFAVEQVQLERHECRFEEHVLPGRDSFRPI